MPTKRYAVILRLWQVKTDVTLPGTTELPTEPDSAAPLGQLPQGYHWRGAVQVAGDSQIHYFDSWSAMNHIIEQIVSESY